MEEAGAHDNEKAKVVMVKNMMREYYVDDSDNADVVEECGL